MSNRNSPARRRSSFKNLKNRNHPTKNSKDAVKRLSITFGGKTTHSKSRNDSNNSGGYESEDNRDCTNSNNCGKKGTLNNNKAQVDPFKAYDLIPDGPPPSLIKYKEPVCVAVKNIKGQYIPRLEEDRVPISFASADELYSRTSKTKCVLTLTGDDEGGADSVLNEEELVHLLNNIYSPVLWRNATHAFSKQVSYEKSIPTQVHEMVELLSWMENNDAVKYTIDDNIQSILTEAFDECTRQIILERPLRGILFRRIRDYIQTDIENRKSLYRSAVAYAARKDLNLHRHINKLHEDEKELHLAKRKLVEEIELRKGEKERMEIHHKVLMENHIQEHFSVMAPVKNEKRRLMTILTQLTTLDVAPAISDRDAIVNSITKSKINM